MPRAAGCRTRVWRVDRSHHRLRPGDREGVPLAPELELVGVVGGERIARLPARQDEAGVFPLTDIHDHAERCDGEVGIAERVDGIDGGRVDRVGVSPVGDRSQVEHPVERLATAEGMLECQGADGSPCPVGRVVPVLGDQVLVGRLQGGADPLRPALGEPAVGLLP